MMGESSLPVTSSGPTAHPSTARGRLVLDPAPLPPPPLLASRLPGVSVPDGFQHFLARELEDLRRGILDELARSAKIAVRHQEDPPPPRRPQLPPQQQASDLEDLSPPVPSRFHQSEPDDGRAFSKEREAAVMVQDSTVRSLQSPGSGGGRRDVVATNSTSNSASADLIAAPSSAAASRIRSKEAVPKNKRAWSSLNMGSFMTLPKLPSPRTSRTSRSSRRMSGHHSIGSEEGERRRYFWQRQKQNSGSSGEPPKFWKSFSHIGESLEPTLQQSKMLRPSSLRNLVETVKQKRQGGLMPQDRIKTLSWSDLGSNMVAWFMSAMILMNTVVICLSSDVSADWHGWMVFDFFFAGVFLLETLLKMTRTGICGYFIGDGEKIFSDAEVRWRWFEFALVALSVLELVLESFSIEGVGTKFTIFRMLRLARIVRIFRVFRLPIFADLIMMINGALGGMKTLMWSLVLISMPLFSIAWVLRETLGEDPSVNDGTASFDNVATAFFTMFRCVIGGECTDYLGRPIFVQVCTQHGWAYGLLYCVTLFLMTFGLFNVIAALFVENTLAAAKFNTIFQKRQRLLDAEMFADKAVQLVQFILRIAQLEGISCLSNNTTIDLVLGSSDWDELMELQLTPEFFSRLQDYSEFHDILDDLDVADEDKIDLFGTLDVDQSGTIDLEELVVGIAKLRGDARRSDIVGVSLMTRAIQQSINNMERQVNEKIEAQREALLGMTKHLRQSTMMMGLSASTPLRMNMVGTASFSPRDRHRDRDRDRDRDGGRSRERSPRQGELSEEANASVEDDSLVWAESDMKVPEETSGISLPAAPQIAVASPTKPKPPKPANAKVDV
mmetsp:Transcript_19006/g.40866  ORF Transcript_19006/g.40866 Transcript_19006/m.40866 type:complete len:840 (+) Transcript_19006:202-2721(+)